MGHGVDPPLTVGGPDRPMLRRCVMPEFIFKALSEHPDVGELLRALPLILQGFFEFDYLSVFLDGLRAGVAGWHLPSAKDLLVLTLAPAGERPIEAAQASWVLEHQRPVVGPRLDGTTGVPGAQLLRQRGFQSACALPLNTPYL